MRARLYYLSIEFQRVLSLKFLVKSHQKKSCQGTSVKGLHSQFMSTFKWHVRKEKDVLSSENTHTCSKACWFCPSSPRVIGELPSAQRVPGCRRRCMHALLACPPLKGLPPIFKKRLFQAHTGILVRRD